MFAVGAAAPLFQRFFGETSRTAQDSADASFSAISHYVPPDPSAPLSVSRSPRCIQILRAVAPDAISMRSQYCHRRQIYTVIKMLMVIVMITEILAESFLLLLASPDLMTSPPFLSTCL